MNADRFLYAAYLATWLIHGVYLSSILRRYGRLRQRMKDLGKGGK
jgi:CcmD family protein